MSFAKILQLIGIILVLNALYFGIGKGLNEGRSYFVVQWGNGFYVGAYCRKKK